MWLITFLFVMECFITVLFACQFWGGLGSDVRIFIAVASQQKVDQNFCVCRIHIHYIIIIIIIIITAKLRQWQADSVRGLFRPELKISREVWKSRWPSWAARP